MQLIEKLVVVSLLLFGAQSLCAQTKASDKSWQSDYRQAQDLFLKEKYASAQYLFDRVVKAYPDYADAYYYGAVCSSKLDNNDAQYRMDEFLRRYPQSGRCNMARFYLGNFYYSRSEYPTAMKYYKQVMINDLDFGVKSEYEFKLGYCHFMAGDIKTAKSYFSHQLSGKSKYKNPSLYYYAHIQYMDAQYDLALDNFIKLKKDRRFTRIIPSYEARIYYYLGREEDLLRMAPQVLSQPDAFKKNEIRQMVGELYFNRGEYKKALKYYLESMGDDEGTNIDPNEAQKSNVMKRSASSCTPQDLDYQIGYCYYQLQKYDSAAIYLERKTLCVDSVAQNALYILGDVYLKMNDKDKARSMFLQSSQMKFDAEITEDALFNYAKLSCELNKNPYNESIRSFEEYLKKYPKTKHKTEIQEILTSLYLTTRNYKDALKLIERIPNKTAKLNEAYERIVINRGIELFNAGDVDGATEFFRKATQINAVPELTTDAYYLYGEGLYRQGKYAESRRVLGRFLNSSHVKQSRYYPYGLYTLGYLDMKQKFYGDAQEHFALFLRNNKNVPTYLTLDVYNRMGDCLYVTKSFEESIRYYDKNIAAKAKDADYATYQKSMAYGAIGKYEEKFHYLNTIFERFQDSPLSSKALFEVANTYLIMDNNEQALRYYQNFVKRYPQSSNVKGALLNMGLVYYNTERSNEALDVFDRLLTEYPGTSESRDALSTIKSIYIEQDRAEEYFTYVQKTTNISVSSLDKDSTLYLSAENQYLSGDLNRAITGFENYIKNFPQGLFTIRANYYLADCYNRIDRKKDALTHYEVIIASRRNEYTEKSLSNGASIAYQLADFSKAAQLYQQLVENSESDAMRMQGRVGVMRSWNENESHNQLIAAATALMKEPKVTPELRDEALLLMGRSCNTLQKYDSAIYYYEKLEQSSNGEYSGEAYYTKSHIYYLDNKYPAAEKVIEDYISVSHSDYWLAKMFILWADLYYINGNSLQAKQTLQSIIDNYDGADLVEEATRKLQSIIESETVPASTEQDDDVIIDMSESAVEGDTVIIE